MKLKYLLLLAASAVLLDVSPSMLFPAQVAAQLRSTQQSSAATIYAMANPAVVTVYAGEEIGSGSIVSPDGLVITNNHVAQEAIHGRVKVATATGRQFAGAVIAIDRRNDLALIQLESRELLPAIPLANGSGVQIGARVYAIGSPYGKPGVMTSGTVRAVRSNGDLQSKVLLHPGNSGGPLLNAQGEMIGVNKSILESATGRNTGISFATHVAAAKALIARNRPNSNQVADRSVVDRRSQTVPSAMTMPAVAVVVPTYPLVTPSIPQPALTGVQLGVMIDTNNLMVQQVQLGSPAALAGLRKGDRLLAINGNLLNGFDELQTFLSRRPHRAVLTISRNARPARVEIRF